MADFNFSVFGSAPAGDIDDTSLVDVLERALESPHGNAEWESGRSGLWCYVSPAGSVRHPQGWKLHVSATAASAEEVLARSLKVLLASGSGFKFACTLDYVKLLNARNTSRGHSGKFITIYPESDAEAVRLAAELHDATAGLPGPRILSDRPYAPESLVHYRYGAFVEERRMTNDGFYAWMILDPDGNPVEDRRNGTYAAPSWAVCPFPDNGMGRAAKPSGGSGGVMLGDRFRVKEAIRYLNKGGVYRALDVTSGDLVVIKEARPHVAGDEAGKDTRDRLRGEARALEALRHLGVAPRPVLLFPQGGHLFLAEEMIPGKSLHQWVPDLIGETGWGGHLPRAFEMAARLVDLVSTAHRAGLVLRDFSPGNVIVRPDGRPILIDLEFAVSVDEPEDGPPARVGTPGYGAPEQLAGSPTSISADYYSLGASLCYLFTGSPPYFVDDLPAARPMSERLTEWLAARSVGLDLPPGLSRMFLGLMAEEPERRWTPSQAREQLLTPPVHVPGRSVPRARRDGVPSDETRDQVRRAVEGITGHLIASMTPDSAERLWPVSCAHGAPDPCSLQHGAAGPLGALVRCFELTGDPRVPDVIGTAGRWIARQLDQGMTRPSGLYFGTAGTAWSMLDAGRAIGDDALAAKALAVGDALPVSVPNPDVTHGTAGIGLTALHLWTRTGDTAYADRAAASADALIASADERSGAIGWATPAEYESKLAGKRYHGFAHGIAGVGYFLLACGEAAGRADCLELAVRVGDTLLDQAFITEREAKWGAGTGDQPTAPYWCHGAAGIAGFLVRLHQATGDERFARVADLSAQAVVENAWRGVLGQCHGLSGNGDLLLDMAAAGDRDRHEAAAWRLARVIIANRAYRDGHLVFPGEQGAPAVSWGDGVAGVLGFLLRLQHRSPRMWMADGTPRFQNADTRPSPQAADAPPPVRTAFGPASQARAS
ncbi:class IV lanthionine synthetase LanL [Spirillospora sp. NBC_01491]|uniref:class IV lanthionine synthetase LanL n=1 Tax=Spirillospora sp. NBC_01491 TaxID=2976007 RepID=UPI002E317284|nr:class IV lanthionine synthetase LanL [Spirillospora sp. NBC_01491]